MKNKMQDLRNHLFETLEALADKEQPMEIQRAKAICEVAQTLINSAKVEVDLIRAVGSEEHSEFFGSDKTLADRATEGPALVAGTATNRAHGGNCRNDADSRLSCTLRS